MIRRLGRWLDERLGGASTLRRTLARPFPSHWSFLLGEVALYSFVMLVLTGLYLTFFYVPSTAEVVYDGRYAPLQDAEVSAAYASVVDLSFATRAGLLFRQMHHWAALVFVGAIVCHLARVFFTGAFRRPREINWMVGLTTLLLAVTNGFLGYSLVDDLLSGIGLRITYSIVLSVPVVGTWLAFLIFGGEFPTDDTIPRFFTLHILLIPVAIALLLAVHLAILWRQKHAQFRGPRRTEDNSVGPRLWPVHAAKSGGLFFLVAAVLAALGGLAQINPVWLYGPFDPSAVTAPAQPDWYLGWVDGALRLAPAWDVRIGGFLVPEIFWPAVVLPMVTIVLLYAWPFLEARVTGDRDPHHLLDRPSERPARTALGVSAVAFYGILLVAGGQDVLAVATGWDVRIWLWALRAAVLIVPAAAGLGTYLILRSGAAAT